MTDSNQAFDIVVYGATSFVGQILTEYLRDYGQLSHENAEKFTWAIAGRSQAKLLELKTRLNMPDIPHFVADATDEVELTKIANSTKVIITTVGPYALFGETMVKVCAHTGTDYCDLTGEPQWIKAMLDKYEDQAKQSGARIINSAGFDSIPSDLGVYVTQNAAIQRMGSPAQQIKMRVRKLKGTASGGTIASMLNIFQETKDNPAIRKLLVNPYVLCPEDHPFNIRQKSHSKAEYDSELKMWTMPFIMAAINERIVHRSNALLENQYGIAFVYDEAMSAKSAFQAWSFTLGLGCFMIATSIGPLRNLLVKHVLPKPGEGPSLQEQLNGMYDMRFYANIPNAQSIIVKVEGDRDPGYGSTAKMLAQVGLCLANDVPTLAGGFWTPAAALNEHLIARLKEHAGVTIEVMQ